LLFLVLLYNSPAGLAFYWTLNNVFSLVKNLFYKLKKPGFVFSIILAVIGVCSAFYINTVYYTPFPSRKLRLTIIALLLILPLIVFFCGKRLGNPGKGRLRDIKYEESHRNVFLLSGVLLSILTGVMIPSSIVKVSPTEFMDIINLKSPNYFVIHSFLIAVGKAGSLSRRYGLPFARLL